MEILPHKIATEVASLVPNSCSLQKPLILLHITTANYGLLNPNGRPPLPTKWENYLLFCGEIIKPLSCHFLSLSFFH